MMNFGGELKAVTKMAQAKIKDDTEEKANAFIEGLKDNLMNQAKLGKPFYCQEIKKDIKADVLNKVRQLLQQQGISMSWEGPRNADYITVEYAW